VLAQGFAFLHRQCRFLNSYSLRGNEIEAATGKLSKHTSLYEQFFKIAFMLSQADGHSRFFSAASQKFVLSPSLRPIGL
jgi:hypothetical protein